MVGIGLALAALIGVALGLMGGGGSILTVPIFVYVLGFGAKEAIALSLAVVGAVSLVGAVGHWRAGNVRVRVALTFGAVAMLGTYAGARLATLVSGRTQLLIFAGVMLVAAWFMFRDRDVTEGASVERRGALRSDGTAWRARGRRPGAGSGDPGRRPWLRYGLIVGEGLGVGVLTGLVGVGGGFLIVPVLVLLAGLTMKEAVGTSLLVIALKSGAGVYGYLGQVEVPWAFLALFTAVAIGGILAGTYLIRYVSQAGLRRSFAAFLVVMGSWILWQNRAAMVPDPAPYAAPESPEATGSPAGSVGMELKRTEGRTGR
jgi:hypothetical protein